MEIETRVADGCYKTHKLKFDPADDEGHDLMKVPEGEKLIRPIPRARYGPHYSGPKKRPPKQTVKKIRVMNSHQLHEFASQHDWEDGLEKLREVLDHPQCDAGTALMLYWLCDPHAYDEYGRADEVDEVLREEYDFMVELERRLLRGDYATGKIAFDPTDHNGMD